MTVYIKHPALGNKHVTQEEYEKLRSESWVKWPRSPEEKAGVPRETYRKSTVDSVRPDYPFTKAQCWGELEKTGVAVDKRWGVNKMREMLGLGALDAQD